MRRGPLLGREPVVTVSVTVALLLALLPVLSLPTEAAGLVAAATVALGGVASAWLVSVDRALPLLVGAGQAVLAAVASLGLELPDHWVSALLAVLTVISGLHVREKVVPAQGPQWDGIDVKDAWIAALSVAEHPKPLRRFGESAPDTPREDDTQVFQLEPDSVYRLDETITYDGPPPGQHREAEDDRQGRHRAGGVLRGQLSPEHGV